MGYCEDLGGSGGRSCEAKITVSHCKLSHKVSVMTEAWGLLLNEEKCLRSWEDVMERPDYRAGYVEGSE